MDMRDRNPPQEHVHEIKVETTGTVFKQTVSATFEGVPGMANCTGHVRGRDVSA
jgi:hypothetical protein